MGVQKAIIRHTLWQNQEVASMGRMRTLSPAQEEDPGPKGAVEKPMNRLIGEMGQFQKEMGRFQKLVIEAIQQNAADRATLKDELAAVRRELAELREIVRKLAQAAGIVGFSGMS
jgi:hypothetical protein